MNILFSKANNYIIHIFVNSFLSYHTWKYTTTVTIIVIIIFINASIHLRTTYPITEPIRARKITRHTIPRAMGSRLRYSIWQSTFLLYLKGNIRVIPPTQWESSTLPQSHTDENAHVENMYVNAYKCEYTYIHAAMHECYSRKSCMSRALRGIHIITKLMSNEQT